MPGNTRAQTPLDFAIAMGIFLIAVTFVFTFIPSLTTPFVEGNQDRSVTADRVASHLSEGALGDPGEPFVVNSSCTDVFFDDSTDDSDIPGNCGYSGDDLYDRVGVDGSRLSVNVTVEQIDPDATGDARFRTVCTDGSGDVVHEDIGCGGVEYEAGDAPTNQSSVVVARRIVTVPGCDFGSDVETCDVTLEVRVW